MTGKKAGGVERTWSNDGLRPVPTPARDQAGRRAETDPSPENSQPAGLAPDARASRGVRQPCRSPADEHSPSPPLHHHLLLPVLPDGHSPALLGPPGGEPRELRWYQGRQDAPDGGHLPSTITAMHTHPWMARARTQHATCTSRANGDRRHDRGALPGPHSPGLLLQGLQARSEAETPVASQEARDRPGSTQQDKLLSLFRRRPNRGRAGREGFLHGRHETGRAPASASAPSKAIIHYSDFTEFPSLGTGEITI